MHTEVSADVSDYVGGLQAAINRTDEFGDQSAQAARRVDRLGEDSTSTAARLNAFSASAMGATAATQALSTATTASLVPAIGALSTTLVPLTVTLGGMATALGGVAAGFGAVIGTGAFAYGEELAGQNEERLEQINEKISALEGLREETGSLTDAQQEQLDSLQETRDEVEETTSVTGALAQEMQPARDQLRETAMTLGSAFVPLIRDAIDALPAFIRRMEESIGPLQPFADALRDAGQVAFRVIPEITAVIMDLGREALPTVRDFGAFIADNAVPALEGMADTTGRVADIMPDLGSGVLDVIPALNEFGLQVLEEVVPALTATGSRVMDVVEAFNRLDERSQEVAIGGALAAPAALGIITKLTMISPILGGIAAAAVALGAAWTANFGNIQEHVANFIEVARPVFEDVMAVVDDTAETVTTVFGDVSDALADSEGAFEDFERSVGSALSGVVNFAETVLLPAFEFVWSEIAPIINTVGNAIARNLSPVVSEAAETINTLVGRAEVMGDVMLGVWNTVDGVVVPIVKTVADVIDTTIGSAIDMLADGLQLVMNLVQGDFGAAFGNLKDMLSEGLENALDVLGILKDGFSDAVEWLATEGPSAFVGSMTALLETAFDIVGAVSGGLASLGEKGVEWMKKKASGFFDAVVNFFKDAVIGGIQEGLSLVQLPPALGGGSGGDGGDGDQGGGSGGGGESGLVETFLGMTLQSGATGGFISEGGMMNVHAGERLVPAAQVTDRGEVSVQGGGPSEVVVRFEGDGALVDLVQSEAEVVVERDNRKKKRANKRTGIRGRRP